MNRILLLLLTIATISCEKKPLTPQEMILGNWSVVDTTSGNHYTDKTGFEFVNDSICDYKLGFFDYNRLLESIRKHTDMDDNFIHYLGTGTKYSVTKDSLKIFNLSEKKWDNYKIKSFTEDTLRLLQDTVKTTLVKKQYNVNSKAGFDAVIVSNSGCFGICPVVSIMIEKNGIVNYNSSYHTVKKGCYTDKIPSAQFDKIALGFEQADYMSLDNNYSTAVTDNSRVSVAFIKNGRIVKSVSDYASSSPNEFIWAYTPLIYLDQKLINSKPKKIQDYLKLEFPVFVSLKKGNLKLELTDAELFFIFNNLQNGKETGAAFKEDYVLDYHNELITKITTDGRYYKLHFKDGSYRNIDIGYNFIKENKLTNKFYRL